MSIVEETDRIRMAKFQAEWSRRFYDVRMPCVMKIKICNQVQILIKYVRILQSNAFLEGKI